MHPIKYGWGLRAVLYKPFFGKIGNPTYIGKPCFIEGCRNIVLGNRVRIFPGIRMEAIGQGKITVGNNTAIEQNVHIASLGGVLSIGNDVTIAANVLITNLDHTYANIQKSVLEQGDIERETRIDDGCFIGYGAAILAGTKLGRHCVVGAGTVVRGEYPDYCVIVGNPARVVKRYDFETKTWVKMEEK